MLLASMAAALAISAAPADWRDSFVLPALPDARTATDCPAPEETSDRYICLTFPREKARDVRNALFEGLRQDGFYVGRAPEADFGFLREPNSNSCESGLGFIYIVEGETDPTKTAVMLIALNNDTCGDPATGEDNQ
ncbi:hypothetical protein D3C80_803010 [compost metagenome]